MWGCGSSTGETVAQRKAWRGQGWRGEEECAVFFSARGVWVWKSRRWFKDRRML